MTPALAAPSHRSFLPGAVSVLALLASGAALPDLVLGVLDTRSATPAVVTVAVAALACVAAVGVCRFAWRDGKGIAAIVFGYVLAVIAAAITLVGTLFVVAATESCGDSSAAADALTLACGAAAYFAVGGWAFVKPSRVVWAWPLAVVVGIALLTLVGVLVPHEPGVCFE